MKVAVVIPAYNEERHIARVLRVVVPLERIDDIIVVSDGSTDRTAQVAGRFRRVRVIELECNMGKGAAMVAGARAADADVILFLDADLVGLTREHVMGMVEPVLRGEADMTVGVFGEGRLATDWAQKIAPDLSGQRAVKRQLLEEVPGLESVGFGVEVALSRHAEKNGARIVYVPLLHVGQVMKEEKAGLWRGLRARARMYWEIIRAFR